MKTTLAYNTNDLNNDLSNFHNVTTSNSIYSIHTHLSTDPDHCLNWEYNMGTQTDYPQLESEEISLNNYLINLKQSKDIQLIEEKRKELNNPIFSLDVNYPSLKGEASD